jgi:ribosome biogenesis protein ERB1
VYLQGKPLIEITARNTRAVLVHQLSKQQTQNPFRKHHGRVVRVLFHPQRPFLFVATKMHVRVYNLAKQQLAKKLMTSLNGISSMAVHPGGMYKNSFYLQVFVFIKRASLSRASKRTCFVSFSDWTFSLTAGDNLILGSQESKLAWFDMDLSTKPYKILK